MRQIAGRAEAAGGAIFARLKALGVDYVFCNSGTDFPPIIEGLAEAAATGEALPEAVVIPHEHAAMGMAHGYWQATGRAQAVMLHTNVGLANGAIGAINAACDNIPMLLMSGRTPVAEHSRFGARTVPIGWGQEMRDQAALVREACKWDYELRFPDQIGQILDRAAAIAESTPKGPVYLSLPRETLCETIDPAGLDAPPSMAPARTAPRPADMAALARMIAAARRPLVIAQRGAGSAEGFAALTRLAEDWALPVCHWWACAIAIPTGHPMEVGADPGPWLEEADLVIALDSLAPWQPDIHKPRPEAKIVHLGPNPLHARTPVRNFRSDLSLAGETDEIVAMLAEALAPLRDGRGPEIDARRRRVAERAAAIRAEVMASAEAMTPGGRSRIRAGSATGFRRRSASAWRARTGWSSRRWGTAATCSPTRPSATRSPNPSGSRWSFLCSTTPNGAPSGSRRRTSTRTATPRGRTGCRGPLCSPARTSR